MHSDLLFAAVLIGKNVTVTNRGVQEENGPEVIYEVLSGRVVSVGYRYNDVTQGVEFKFDDGVVVILSAASSIQIHE